MTSGRFAVDVQGVSSGYGGEPVIFDIELAVAKGTITALMGRNGSGKSTLIKALCKSVPQYSGSIALMSEPLIGMNVEKLARTASYVPQQEVARFGFSVLEMVLMARTSFGVGLYESKSDVQIAENAMLRAGCENLRDRAATELSGGEMQRVLIARALAQECDIVLMDEPTSHLDISHRLQIERLIRELRTEGKTVILATHDFQSAASVADRIVVLDRGRIMLNDSAQAVLESRCLDDVYQVSFNRINGYGPLPILIAEEINSIPL
jgi:iron complex transport system ATP-binding protein